MEDTNTQYLFPAYRIMHCGLGNNYTEYPLSKVLGSWGITIREIGMWGNGMAVIKCYGGKDGEITFGTDLQISPLSALEFNLQVSTHYLDLILRYEEDEQHNLYMPKWTKAIWMNFGGCYVADVVGQKNHMIRFMDDFLYPDTDVEPIEIGEGYRDNMLNDIAELHTTCVLL